MRKDRRTEALVLNITNFVLQAVLASVPNFKLRASKLHLVNKACSGAYFYLSHGAASIALIPTAWIFRSCSTQPWHLESRSEKIFTHWPQGHFQCPTTSTAGRERAQSPGSTHNCQLTAWQQVAHILTSPQAAFVPSSFPAITTRKHDMTATRLAFHCVCVELVS